MPLSIVILAAGQGTRMRSSLPKVLQPLAGQPLLRHVVNCARELTAEDICVVYGHGGDAVPMAFEGESLRWALQSEQLGTGHAVMQAMPQTPGGNQVLILAGDVPLLRATTLRRLLDACGNDEFGILTVDLENPQGYGRIVRDDKGVQRIVEEKDTSEAERKIREINSGVMCCNANALKKWLDQLDNDNSQGEYYLTDVIALAVADGVAVHGIKAEDVDEVMGINDKTQLAQAERALQKRRVEALMAKGVGFADPARVDIRGTLTCGRDVYIDVNAVFEGDVVLEENVVIEANNLIRNCKLGAGTVVHPNCHLEGAAMGANCELGPYARLRPGANLADNVKAGNFVEIKKSNIGPGSKVNHLTYIGDTEMGSGVNVGAGTITCNYDGANKHLTKIGDGAFIGSGVNLIAPVEVGAGATVGAGTTLSKAAPVDKLTLARARQVTIENWQKPKKTPKPAGKS
ncbi:MAG: bifunctional UDP-N-acetylglucosamine diphosphorylase/glucosamine-1-phosphate N-acetyltransferase GlmU [Woeseia sp.]|nr:bifunctional UDP-N-acetylglucosamine diphosphorylase/glucosamine-1-phosphate N-acetyltransferase GlmU [Woeseia sp.]